jgi:hypothetical protein
MLSSTCMIAMYDPWKLENRIAIGKKFVDYNRGDHRQSSSLNCA